MQTLSLFWHRRDLRTFDNTALCYALVENSNVQPLFIFDENILATIEDKNDPRVTFIYNSIVRLKKEYQKLGTDLWVFYGDPLTIFQDIIKNNNVNNIYFNNDYEPYAITRDKKIKSLLEQSNITIKTYKDHVFFEPIEIVKDDQTPFTVFTPYSKKWLQKFSVSPIKIVNTEKLFNQFNKTEKTELFPINKIGFSSNALSVQPPEINIEFLHNYEKNREFPFLNATSHLSIHLRFGTISIRQLIQKTKANPKFINELIWREFYQMLIYFYPNTIHLPYKKKFQNMVWLNNPSDFEKWCNGQTGYAIVDAGMRELNQTGFMHNRVRMIVASFLTKHLLIDWTLGEAWFAKKLMDYEQASNVGNWQWAAGCGSDAAPYFRIFNPLMQVKKFDSKNHYITKWVPEWNTTQYTKPIVEHVFARKRALITFKSALL